MNGFNSEADAIRKRQDLGSEQMVVEELRMELKVLRLYIRKNDNIVFFKNLLILAGGHVVEIPCRDTHDFVPPTGLDG